MTISQDRLFAGIDVSAKTFVVRTDATTNVQTYGNTPAGHGKLIRRLSKCGPIARVVLEASGVYSLDLALALHRAPNVEVMVLNPRVARNFAKALKQRSKTDPADAEVLLEYARRMDFQPWKPPSKEALELRALLRRRASLVKARTAEKNRLHAVTATHELSPLVRRDIQLAIRQLTKRISNVEKLAQKLVERTPAFHNALRRLITVKGIATVSGLHILAEILAMPEGMTAKQWVAHAGLDPRHFQSGETVHKAPKITKAGNAHLRASLYMPALVAIQNQPTVKAFYENLLQRGKAPMQAVVAVMRKILVAIHAMLKHDVDYDTNRFYKLPDPA